MLLVVWKLPNVYTHFTHFFTGSPAAARSSQNFDVETNHRRNLFNWQLSARHSDGYFVLSLWRTCPPVKHKFISWHLAHWIVVLDEVRTKDCSNSQVASLNKFRENDRPTISTIRGCLEIKASQSFTQITQIFYRFAMDNKNSQRCPTVFYRRRRSTTTCYEEKAEIRAIG